MDIAYRLALSSPQNQGEGPGFAVTLLGLTDNPTFGPCAERGRQIEAVATGAVVPAGLTYQWHVAGQGPVAGATAATFTPDAPLADASVIYCVISAPEGMSKSSASVVYRQVPPALGTALFDEIYDLDTGVQTVAAADGFVGQELHYAVSGAGATIDAGTGDISLPTDLPLDGEIITVTASNSGGTLSTTFLVTVENVALDGALPFGALTPAGMGGVPVAATAITSGDPGGHWEIAGGHLVPSASGAGALAGVYPLVFDTGATLDVLIEEDRASANIDELETVFAGLPLSARGIMVHDGDGRALGRLRLVPKIFAQEMVLEPTNWVEDADPRQSLRPVTLAGLTIGGDLSSGDINNRMENLTVQGFICQMEQGPGEGESNNGIIRVERPSRHVTIRQNEIWSRDTREIEEADDFRDNLNTCRMLRGIATSIEQNGATNEHIRIEDNFIHDVSRGVIMVATNEYGGQRSRLCGNVMLECYTNFYTIGYLNGLDIFDNKCMGISAQIQDTQGAIPATSPHASTGLSGDVGGSQTTHDVTAMGNFQHIGWLRKLIQEELSKTVGDTAATGAKFNDPSAFDSYYNIIFAFNTIVSHGFSLELTGASADSHNLIFNNSLIYESYVRDGSPPILAFGGVTRARMFNNLSTSYDIHGEDGSSQVGGVKTLDTLEGYGNLRLGLGTSGFGEESYFVGDPVKGFSFLTLDEAMAAYVPIPGARALSADQKKGALGTGLYQGDGVHSVVYDKPAPSGGTSHAYPTTVWSGQYIQRNNNAGLSLASTTSAGLTFALQGSTSSVIDGVSRCLFSMTGQRVKINKLGSGRFDFRAEKTGNATMFTGQVDHQTFSSADGKTSLLASFNFQTGETHFVINGVLANWIDFDNIDSGTLDLSVSNPRVFANELTARGDNWEGELDLFYLDDAVYDLERVAELDRFLAADGYFKDFGSDGSAPNGTSPLLYIAGDAASIAGIVNKGRGGICVLSNGAPADAS